LLETAENLLASVARDRHRLEQAELCIQFGFFHSLRGNVAKGDTACRNAYRLATAEKLPRLQIRALHYGLIARMFLGKLKEMDENVKEAERLGIDRYPELQAMFAVNRAMACIFTDRSPESGVALLEESLTQIRERGLWFLFPPTLLHYAICLYYAGRHPEAEETLERLIAEGRARGNESFTLSVATMFLGMSKYRSGDFPSAIRNLEKARGLFQTRSGRADPHRRLLESGLQMSRLKAGLPVETDRLDHALAYFEEIGSLWLVAEMLFAKALVCQERGDIEKARPLLERALEIMADRGYERCMDLAPVDLAKAACRALEICGGRAAETAMRLLIHSCPAEAFAEVERIFESKNRKARKRAREVLRSIHLEGRPRVRIDLLGGFRVWRGDRPVTGDEWGGTTPQFLLQALVSIGGRRAPREVLMEALWPESPPQASERNFKTALHRLRRVLEPDLDPRFGSSYLVLRDNILTMTELVDETDVERLVRSISEGHRAETGGRMRDAIEAYDRADALYRGSFLPESSHQGWCVEKKRQLDDGFIEMLFRKAQLHETKGAYRRAAACYEKAIGIEPAHEEAYQSLMLVYLRRGRRDAAIRTYRRCEESLGLHLNLSPGETTRAIYEKIVDPSA
jgi:DNA-binding SARP family transcriptional activator